MSDLPVTYDPVTDMMRIEFRSWPSPMATDRPELIGGEDAGEDLVIHYGPDGQPFAWEIESASRHPDLVMRALRALRTAAGIEDAA